MKDLSILYHVGQLSKISLPPPILRKLVSFDTFLHEMNKQKMCHFVKIGGDEDNDGLDDDQKVITCKLYL
jgi:hypothetical protein